MNLRNAPKAGTAISKYRTNPPTLSSDKYLTLEANKIQDHRSENPFCNYSAPWSKGAAIDLT